MTILSRNMIARSFLFLQIDYTLEKLDVSTCILQVTVRKSLKENTSLHNATKVKLTKASHVQYKVKNNNNKKPINAIKVP